MGESRGSISRSRSKSRTRGIKEDAHSKHSTSTRSSTRRSTGSDSHNKSSHGERRSSRQSEDILDEMDGNASFHRTLLLARSLHSSDDDGNDGNDFKSPRRSSGQSKKDNHDREPTKESRTETRSSSEEHKTPRSQRRSELGESNSRTSQLRRSDNAIPVNAVHDTEKPKMRLSDVASAMRDAPKASKSPRDYHPEPLKKKHSSDDILLMSPDDLDVTRTPSGRDHRTLPSRSYSNRTPNSRQEKRVPYHSPQTKKKYLVSPTSEEHSRTHLARSRSDGTYKTESPTKMVQSRHNRRTSEIQPISPMTSSPTTYGSSQTPRGDKPARRNSIDLHSPSSSLSPAVTPGRARRRSSMDMPSPSSASSSTSHRRSSMDLRSPVPPMAPSLSGGPPTPFERLSELEKIKQFLTDEIGRAHV